MQIAPITNERDTVVLYLCTFTDITALKQPIETEDIKGGLSKFARIAKSVTRNRSILMNFTTPNARSIGIDSTKTSQLPNVCPRNSCYALEDSHPFDQLADCGRMCKRLIYFSS